MAETKKHRASAIRSAPMAKLLHGPTLPVEEVRAALAEELDRERAECHAEMCAILDEARREEPFVSSAMFKEPASLVVERDRTARLFQEKRAAGLDHHDVGFRVMQGIAHQCDAEFRAAVRLRKARLLVQHADRPDYWRALEQHWFEGRGFPRDHRFHTEPEAR